MKPTSSPSCLTTPPASPRIAQRLPLLTLPFLLLLTLPLQSDPLPLPATTPLEITGDIASNLVAGVDRFLLRELDRAPQDRARFWPAPDAGPEAWTTATTTNRQRLAHILGLRDPRPAAPQFEILSAPGLPCELAQGQGFRAFQVRWTAVDDVHAEGLLLRPSFTDLDESLRKRYGLLPVQSAATVAPAVIAIPDADQTPEQIAGLADGLPPEAQFARRLAESGCEVLIPTLINRRTGLAKSADGQRGRNLTHREFLYRAAFPLGRHLLGYELQKILAGVDWFATNRSAPPPQAPPRPTLGVIGWGEGARLALLAAALDPRIHVAALSATFGPQESAWQQPIDRNVFGLLERFGDAELAALIAPRSLLVEAARGPEVNLPPGTGGAPGQLATWPLAAVQAEFNRAQRLAPTHAPHRLLELLPSNDGTGPALTPATLNRFLETLAPGARLLPTSAVQRLRPLPDPEARHQRALDAINRHTQRLLVESPYVRAEFMKQLNHSSLPQYTATLEPYRTFFHDQVIGRLTTPRLPPNPRSRIALDHPKWTGHEVVLDVFPDVIAYGLLLVPKNLKPDERRPVVVCQHGLEGRPLDVVQGNHEAYHDFAAKLAEQGFITFAPQNLYLFQDRFRTLQRKANLLGKTLFSLIVPQHQQITDWLATLPFVDPDRIAFYGLSYGGKTAMRVPALVTRYCLSICSADFNEWVWKNASTRSPYSYVWTGEYEIFEFDLGSTFNYAEMAALIAPRPFMVERGHFDGVAPDETVAYEFAKVRHLYAAQLRLPDHCAIEWFVGPHTIHGQGTFEFLRRHLRWP